MPDGLLRTSKEAMQAGQERYLTLSIYCTLRKLSSVASGRESPGRELNITVLPTSALRSSPAHMKDTSTEESIHANVTPLPATRCPIMHMGVSRYKPPELEQNPSAAQAHAACCCAVRTSTTHFHQAHMHLPLWRAGPNTSSHLQQGYSQVQVPALASQGANSCACTV